MGKRIKPKAELITTLDAADAALKSIGEAERELERIKADRDDEIAEIKEESKGLAKPFQGKIKALGAALENFFNFRGADHLKGDAKSLQLTHGTIGTRKTPPKLELAEGYTEEMVIGELLRLGRPEAVRKVEALNKEELHKWTDADLAAIGMVRTQIEEFFVKPDVTALGEVA